MTAAHTLALLSVLELRVELVNVQEASEDVFILGERSCRVMMTSFLHGFEIFFSLTVKGFVFGDPEAEHLVLFFKSFHFLCCRVTRSDSSAVIFVVEQIRSCWTRKLLFMQELRVVNLLPLEKSLGLVKHPLVS